MGCLDVEYMRIGGGVQSAFVRVGDFLASFALEKTEIRSSFLLVCGVPVETGHLCASDARLLTYDGMTMSVIEI